MQGNHAIGQPHQVVAGLVGKSCIQHDRLGKIRDLPVQPQKIRLSGIAVGGLYEQGGLGSERRVGPRRLAKRGNRRHRVLAFHIRKKIERGINDKALVGYPEVGTFMRARARLEVQQLPGMIDRG